MTDTNQTEPAVPNYNNPEGCNPNQAELDNMRNQLAKLKFQMQKQVLNKITKLTIDTTDPKLLTELLKTISNIYV